MYEENAIIAANEIVDSIEEKRPEAYSGSLLGIVLKANSGIYMVQPDGETACSEVVVPCILRGNLKKNLTYSTSGSRPKRVTEAKRPYISDSISVGDRVRFSPLEDNQGIIEEIFPRTSSFSRSGFRGRVQTLVTNLDLLVIVFACAEPNPDHWRIDRWLAAAEYHGIEPLLLANKLDLVEYGDFEKSFAEYSRIGYRVLPVSSKKQIGIEELRAELHGKISAVTGPSGVGKSSLLNSIQPGLKLATGDIGDITFKGKHTTTARELIPLITGGWVADTPGLRKLELLKMSREELMECFVEFGNALDTPCRFRDCKHKSEPGCSLKAAVENGEISARRFESFHILSGELK